LVAAALLSLLWTGALAQVPVRSYADGFVKRFSPDDPDVSYTVTVRDGDRNAYHVEVAIRNLRDSTVALRLPNWAPGHYRTTNAWRRIRGFTAADPEGRPLAVTKPDSLTWVVAAGDRRSLLVRYSVAVTAAANNRLFLRQETGLIDGPATFIYLVGRQHLPSHVWLSLPAGWRVGTGLMATPDSTVYFATSYDVLIDSPILVGRFQRWVFTAGRTPHAIVVANDGRPALFDTLAFVDMVRRLTETAIAVFGQAPYKDYTYIYVVGGGGGLEHLNSTTIGLSAAAMARDVRDAASVTAHEFFHTWNVKRIRPAVLGPFDYTRPQRSLGLWISEGNTSYFGGLIQLRAGLITRDAWRGTFQNLIGQHQANPARLIVSPERASWTTWDPPGVNDGLSISYYDQGQQLGLLLDIAIRDSTDNRRSWDDVFRYLFAHYAGERGFTSEDLLHAVNEVSGSDFQDFFRKYVSGTVEIPWNAFLERMGWHVEFRDSTAPVDRRVSFLPPGRGRGAVGPAESWRVVVSPGSAFQAAGLRTGDTVLAVNGSPLTESSAPDDVVRALRQGETMTLEVPREGRRVTLRVQGQPYTTTVAALTELSGASARAVRIREGIMAGTTDR
jgi:predicted metalloprotease with PDZ domain